MTGTKEGLTMVSSHCKVHMHAEQTLLLFQQTAIYCKNLSCLVLEFFMFFCKEHEKFKYSPHRNSEGCGFPGFGLAFKRLKQKGIGKISIKKGLGVLTSTLSYLKKQYHVSVVLTKVQKAIKHSLNWRTATGRWPASRHSKQGIVVCHTKVVLEHWLGKTADSSWDLCVHIFPLVLAAKRYLF